MLQLSYTDRSGTTHPAAVLVYSHLRLQTDPPAGELLLSVYHDLASYEAGRDPVDPPLLAAFSAQEIGAIAAQFGNVPYGILQARTPYQSAVLVTP